MKNSSEAAHGFQTLAVHAGRGVDALTGAVALPISMSTTFERDPDGGFTRNYNYVRVGNPTRAALEACLSALEGGEQAITFSSGMAAAFAVLQALSPRDHVVLHRDMYFGVRELIEGVFTRWGLEHTFVDMRDERAVHNACRPHTKLLWLETPSNPLIEVVTIPPIAEIAKEIRATFVCDNTFATPALQRPLLLGADIAVHSLTKYLSGHGDMMGGAVVMKQASEFGQRMRDFQTKGGVVLAPFDCWLILRGIETISARMRIHCENARQIANFLSTHPAVSAVHYPGLTNDPGHEAAKRQMLDFGGMLSFEVRGGRQEAFQIAACLKLITRATSLGGTHTLIEHRASIEGVHTRSPESLLRLSVGIEDANDLIQDLDRSLKTLL